MTRALILLVLISACAQVASAQTSGPVADTVEFNDVIIVTTGGRIVGEIIEYEEGEKVVILREDGERFEIPWDRIARITRLGEEDQTQQLILDSLAQPRLAPRIRPHGIGRLVFNSSNLSSWGGVHALGGMTIRDNFFVGLGTGWEILTSVDGGFLPLIVEVTWFPVDAPAAPFFALEAGHMIGWIEGDHSADYDGNWIGLAYGILVSFWDESGLSFRMGLRRFSMNNHPLFIKKKNQPSFSLGVVF